MENGLSQKTVLVRGGGDLATGVALRLHRCGLAVMVTELPQPIAVRRRVCFAEAVYSGTAVVEDCTACRIPGPGDAPLVWQTVREGRVPVIVDPEGESVRLLRPAVVVDARMLKEPPKPLSEPVELLIGLGPGFAAGENCDAVIETNRGISLGRVVWKGSAEPDTREPEAVVGHGEDRVLLAPADGRVTAHTEIGAHVQPGQLIAEVGGHPVKAAFKGVLRGLIHPDVRVKKGTKIGDLDPRDDPRACFQVSDKSLAVAGGVLEAILLKVVGSRQWAVGSS